MTCRHPPRLRATAPDYFHLSLVEAETVDRDVSRISLIPQHGKESRTKKRFSEGKGRRRQTPVLASLVGTDHRPAPCRKVSFQKRLLSSAARARDWGSAPGENRARTWPAWRYLEGAMPGWAVVSTASHELHNARPDSQGLGARIAVTQQSHVPRTRRRASVVSWPGLRAPSVWAG